MDNWSDEALADIGLERTDGAFRINIPDDANIYSMALRTIEGNRRWDFCP